MNCRKCGGAERYATGHCKVCKRTANRERMRKYRATPEGLKANRERDRQYRATPEGRTAKREADRKYLATPEALEANRERDRQYRATPEGRTANREANRKWRATPEGKAVQLAATQTRRAMLKGAYRDGTHAHWKTRLALHDGTCVYCVPGTKHERLTLDHLQPLAKGGAHVLVNFVPACRFHNTCKCDFVIDFEAARRVDPEITARILTFVEGSRRFLFNPMTKSSRPRRTENLVLRP